MNAGYRETDVAVAEDGGRIVARFLLDNRSGETWSPSRGFAIGYHLFDPETDTLLVDGARTALHHEIEPGGSERVEVSVPVPCEPGRYRVFVSPLREDVSWYYEQGWPFLLIDVVRSGGAIEVQQSRIATLAALRWPRLRRAILRAWVYPARTLWRNRSLIRTMVRRDILGRYRGSFAGAFWTLLNPLLLMITYFFVFGVVLRARFGEDTSRTGFALYFLAGMLPWLAFSEAAGRAPSVLLEHRNFVKKLVFAVETLPVNLVVAGLVTEIFAIALFLAACLVFRGGVPASALWLPALLVPQILFTAGLCWFLAALGVFVRDLGHISGFLLTLWFFLTPICYPEASLPPAAAPLLTRNPLYVLVRGYRSVLLEGVPPALGPLWKLWVVSTLAFVGGHAWFYKLRKSFADVI
jgi:lipopolysaccharide transport system permease protein